MDHTSRAFTLNSLTYLLLPLILIILFHIINSKRRRLPPGPRQWPIVGNIFQVGNKPHVSLANFAKVHGPLFSLKLGSRVVVVASSPAAASEILKTHDRVLSARCTPANIPYEDSALDRIALIWNPTCSDQWKFLRSMCKNELFSAKAIESQAALRERKVREMLDYLTTKQGQVVDIGEIVFTNVFNIISNLFLSKDLLRFEEQGIAGGLKNLICTMMELATAPNVADFYPILNKLDPQGLKGKVYKCLNKMFSVWESDIKERRAKHVKDAPKVDFLDVCLSNGFDADQINWLLLEFFIAGVDTTTTAVEWGMAELLKNKRLEKVHEELDREIGKHMLKESHIPQLKYLNACVKETLRLHPPGPFITPRRAPQDCEVMNYTIPKDSQILVNVWAIGRDPSAWEDPLSFKPERFLESNLDFKGNNFEFLPFGSGRRICPGLPMATRQLPFILASLIHCFDWSLQNGEDPSMLDMNDSFGLALTKEKHLLVVPQRK